MRQKFSLEAAGRLLGISANAVRARVKKTPQLYEVERDNSGKMWVWIDPDGLQDLKPSKAFRKHSSLDEMKASIDALRTQVDLADEIAALRDDLAEARQRLAVSEAERRSAEALAEDRAQALADLRRLLPPASAAVTPRRRWWLFG